MSNEIRVSVNVQVNNGNYADQFQASASYNQSVQGANGGIFATSTSPVSLPEGSLATVGLLSARNLDASNSIQLGGFASGSFVPFAKLLPGEPYLGRIDTAATLKVQSTAGTPLLQFLWLNN